MKTKYTGGRHFGVGLVAALGIVGMTAMSSTSAMAIESWIMDNGNCNLRKIAAADGDVSAREAKYLVRYYIRQLGFTRPRTSERTARIGSVELDGEKWRVNFWYGTSYPSKKAMFLVDRHSGVIGSEKWTASVTDGSPQ